jgi:tRNA 2-thiouridine synthesizing protein C
MMPPRSVLIVCRDAPYGSGRLRDALDTAMAFGAFEQRVSLLLLEDAVLLLAPGQQSPAGERNLVKLASALPDYGMDVVHVAAGALRDRALDPSALALPAEPLDDAGIAALIGAQDLVLSI